MKKITKNIIDKKLLVNLFKEVNPKLKIKDIKVTITYEK